MLIIRKNIFFLRILLLKLKMAENVTCFNWKFQVLSDLRINDWTEQYAVAAVWLTLWINGFESRPGYRSLFMDIIHAFALCQTQEHSDTHGRYIHCHHRTSIQKLLISNDPIPSQCHLLLLFTINLCDNPSEMRSSFFLGLVRTP